MVRGRRGAVAVLLALVACLTLLGPSGTASAPTVTASGAADRCRAVAHRQNPQRTGEACELPDRTLAQKWSVDLGQPVFYPLVVGNQVFVATPIDSGGEYGTELRALDLRTGAVQWGPVLLDHSQDWAALAYDEGRVYTISSDHAVRAFVARTGRRLWTTQTDADSEIVASDGRVYAGGVHTTALDGATGAALWTTETDGSGAVSVDSTGFYLASGCQVSSLDPATGVVQWLFYTGCTTGGTSETYVYRHRVYDLSKNQVRDTATGRVLGSFEGVPSFADGRVYLVRGDSIDVRDATSLRLIRTIRLPTGITTSAIIGGTSLYVGCGNGRVYRFDLVAGVPRWSAPLPAVPGLGGPSLSRISDIAIGNGRLVVPADTTLTAFG